MDGKHKSLVSLKFRLWEGKKSITDGEFKSKAIEALDKLYEFEQEPVSEDKLQPGRYFAASYGGEHVAGTEFVIGALFVAWGATASNIFLGLLVGNLMAILRRYQ